MYGYPPSRVREILSPQEELFLLKAKVRRARLMKEKHG